ncbi:hypothetical protein D3C75_376710 [compost metagenome]
MLEHHPDLLTQLVNVCFALIYRYSVNSQPAAGYRLQPVDTAQHCAFTGPGRANHDDHFPFLNMQVNTFQHMEMPVMLLYLMKINQRQSSFASFYS